jgi:hypothetical protein
MAASLLLAAAAGAGYYAFRSDPGALEMAAAAVPLAVGSLPREEAGRVDDTPPAAMVPTVAPAFSAAADMATPSGGGGKPSASGIAEPEPVVVANQPVAVPATAETASVPRAELSSAAAAAVGEPYGPGRSGDRTPDAAVAAGDGPATSEGDRIEIIRPPAPVPVDPGPVAPSPETTIGTVEEPVASGSSAPLPGAPKRVVAAAEPAAALPTGTAGAPPAGSFAIYFFSVRPSTRVASEWRLLKERHPDELADLEPWAPRPVKVSGEGTFYRVEAGAFATKAEAQAVCDRLRSRGQSCRVLAR